MKRKKSIIILGFILLVMTIESAFASEYLFDEKTNSICINNFRMNDYSLTSDASGEAEDPYIIIPYDEVKVWKDEGEFWSIIGTYSPLDKGSSIGSFAETKVGDEIVRTTEASLKLNKSIPEGKLFVSRWDDEGEEQKVYIAVTLDNVQGYVDINKISNVNELLQSYIDDCKESAIIPIQDELKREQDISRDIRTQASDIITSVQKSKDSLHILLIVEGVVLLVTILAALALIIFKDVKQKARLSCLKNQIKEIKDQLSSDNKTLTETISEYIKTVHEKEKEISKEELSQKVVKEPVNKVDFGEEFRNKINLLIGNNTDEWNKALLGYNPIFLSYNGVSDWYEESNIDVEPIYICCSDEKGALFVAPSSFCKPMGIGRNTFDIVPTDSGKVGGYRVDKVAEVEKDGTVYKLKNKGKIIYLEN